MSYSKHDDDSVNRLLELMPVLVPVAIRHHRWNDVQQNESE